MAPEAGVFTTTPFLRTCDVAFFLGSADIHHASALWFPQSFPLVAIARLCFCVFKGVDAAVTELVADCIS